MGRALSVKAITEIKNYSRTLERCCRALKQNTDIPVIPCKMAEPKFVAKRERLSDALSKVYSGIFHVFNRPWNLEENISNVILTEAGLDYADGMPVLNPDYLSLNRNYFARFFNKIDDYQPISSFDYLGSQLTTIVITSLAMTSSRIFILYDGILEYPILFQPENSRTGDHAHLIIRESGTNSVLSENQFGPYHLPSFGADISMMQEHDINPIKIWFLEVEMGLIKKTLMNGRIPPLEDLQKLSIGSLRNEIVGVEVGLKKGKAHLRPLIPESD